MESAREGGGAPLLGGATRARGQATSVQTLGNIVVSFLGTGALGLPYAFRVAGWAAGSIGLLLACLATYYCMLLLVECRRKLEEDAQESDAPAQTQTYGDVGANAFGAAGRILTELLILVAHAGAAVAFLIFTCQNLSSIFASLDTGYLISPSAFVFLLLPLEILLSFIRSLSFLAPFSALATLCNVVAMAAVVKEDANQLRDRPVGDRDAFNGPWSVPFACGVAVFCFGGFGMTLPLEGSMAEPRKFPWVLLQAFSGMSLAYICFGTLGYLAYGGETREIITLNLPNSWATVVVKVGLCVAIAFTIPLVVHPIHEIVELKVRSSRRVQKLGRGSRAEDWLGSRLGRLIVVAALGVLATLAPGFTELISFNGSTICALISFVLPTSFHLKIMGSSIGLWRRVVDCCILLVGLAFALHGTYTAVRAAL